MTILDAMHRVMCGCVWWAAAALGGCAGAARPSERPAVLARDGGAVVGGANVALRDAGVPVGDAVTEDLPFASRVERARRRLAEDQALGIEVRPWEGVPGATIVEGRLDDTVGIRAGTLVMDEGEADLARVLNEYGESHYVAAIPGELRLRGDPRSGFAFGALDGTIAFAVRAGGDGVAVGGLRCRPGEPAVVRHTICGPAAACASSAALAWPSDQDCVRSLRALQVRAEEAAQDLHERAVRALPTAVESVTETGVRAQEEPHGALPSAEARARSQRRMLAQMVALHRQGRRFRGSPEACGGDVLDPPTIFRYGAVDPAGASLALALSESSISVSGVFRLQGASVAPLFDRDGNTAIDAWFWTDLTGDGIDELVFRGHWDACGAELAEGVAGHCAWWVASPSWPRAMQVHEVQDCMVGAMDLPRSPVITLRPHAGSDRGALIVAREPRVWDGHAFRPAASGLDDARAFTVQDQSWHDATPGLDAVDDAPPGWDSASSPCDNPVRVGWALARARRIAPLGAAAQPALLGFIARSVGLDQCPATSLWSISIPR